MQRVRVAAPACTSGHVGQHRRDPHCPQAPHVKDVACGPAFDAGTNRDGGRPFGPMVARVRLHGHVPGTRTRRTGQPCDARELVPRIAVAVRSRNPERAEPGRHRRRARRLAKSSFPKTPLAGTPSLRESARLCPGAGDRWLACSGSGECGACDAAGPAGPGEIVASARSCQLAGCS